MNIYEKMYLELFNAVTDALKLLEEESEASVLLKKAQMECEQIYIEAEDKESERR